MLKVAFSSAFILTSLAIIALAFPLYGGWIEPNELYNLGADGSMSDEDWYAINRSYGAGAFAYGCIILGFHLFALAKRRSLSTGKYIQQSILVAVVTLIPAYLVMLIQ